MSVAKDVADNAATALVETEASATKEAGEEGTPGLAKLIVKKRSEKEKADRVKDEVERYCEKFEKEVLRLFDRSYRKGDPRMMAVGCPLGVRRLSDMCSTVQRHCRISTGVHLVYRFMSTNTISLSQKIGFWRKRRMRRVQ
jgi:hypothetical protein